ncbi:MAG: redoxin family protein, partial [Patescibacteria group bacterium]
IDVSPTFWTYVSAAILFLFGLTLLFPEAWARLVLKIPGHAKPDAWLAKGYNNRSSFWTDVVIGAALGPVFTTCSPTFFVILATVLPQSFAVGLVDLAAYVVGLALVLLLISWIGQKLVHRLEWAANPYGWFKKVLGVLFIILAILIGAGLDKKLETAILNAGFFDVTKLEESVRATLQSASRSSDESPSSGGFSLGSEKKYTEIVNPAGFINSESFKLADFIGKKVILVDFIDYTCINCQRTFPYMNDWYTKYKDQGLEVVAIHTPEFAFEKIKENVEKGIAQFGLKFPIVLDNDYSTWNAYKNNSWPHKYLIDIHGNVVYDHVGEGYYAETEAKIVEALKDRKKVLNEGGSVTAGTPMPDYVVQTRSPETYFGAYRNETFGNGRSFTIGKGTFTVPEELTPNQYYLGGDWQIEKEYSETTSAGSKVSFVFGASRMYLVAKTSDGLPVTATVLLDGKTIATDKSGADVKDGKLIIDASRLYNLYSSSQGEVHRIDIIFSKPGVEIYTFTFG